MYFNICKESQLKNQSLLSFKSNHSWKVIFYTVCIFMDKGTNFFNNIFLSTQQCVDESAADERECVPCVCVCVSCFVHRQMPIIIRAGGAFCYDY